MILNYGFQRLLEEQQAHSKMKHLQYEELKIQNYLLDKNLSICEKRTLFKFRTHTENFRMNYKTSFEDLTCPVCSRHPDTQQESVFCSKIHKSEYNNITYMNIFKDNIPRKTIDMIMGIMKTREDYSWNNTGKSTLCCGPCVTQEMSKSSVKLCINPVVLVRFTNIMSIICEKE